MLEKDARAEIKPGVPLKLEDKGVFIVQELRVHGDYATVNVVPLEAYKAKGFKALDYSMDVKSL